MILLSNITDNMKEEIILQDIAVNYFNPALKYTLYHYNKEELMRYNYNTCRQTAFIGAAFFSMYCEKNGIPYTFQAFEADCRDVLYGHPASYTHAYIYATNSVTGKHLLIDLSRTEQPIIFFEVPDNQYPKIHGYYKDLEVLRIREVDWREALNLEEYITGLPGTEFLNKVSDVYDQCCDMEEDLRSFFSQMCYSSFTEAFGKEIGAVPEDVPFLIQRVTHISDRIGE